LFEKARLKLDQIAVIPVKNGDFKVWIGYFFNNSHGLFAG